MIFNTSIIIIIIGWMDGSINLFWYEQELWYISPHATQHFNKRDVANVAVWSWLSATACRNSLVPVVVLWEVEPSGPLTRQSADGKPALMKLI